MELGGRFENLLSFLKNSSSLPSQLSFECNPPGSTWEVLRSHSSYNVVFCPGYFSSSLSSYPVLFLKSSELLVSYTTLVLLSLLWLSNKFKITQILNIQLQGLPSIFFVLQSVNSEFSCYHCLNKKKLKFLEQNRGYQRSQLAKFNNVFHMA